MASLARRAEPALNDSRPHLDNVHRADESRFVADSTQPTLRPIAGGRHVDATTPHITTEQIEQARHQAIAEPEPIETVEATEELTEQLTGASIIDRLQRTINNPNLDLRMLQVTTKGMSVEAFAQRVVDRYAGAEQRSPDTIRRTAREYREMLDAQMNFLRGITDIETLPHEQVAQLKQTVERGIVATALGALAERIELSGVPVEETDQETVRTVEVSPVTPKANETPLGTQAVTPSVDQTPTLEYTPVRADRTVEPRTLTEDETPTIVMRRELPPDVQRLVDERAQLIVDCGIAELPVELDQPIDINSREVRTALQTLVGQKEHELRQQAADESYLLNEEGEEALDAYEEALQNKLRRIAALDLQLTQQNKIPAAAPQERIPTPEHTRTPEQPMTPNDIEQRRLELLEYFNLKGLKEPINPASLLFRMAKKERRDAALREFQKQGLEGDALLSRMQQFDAEELSPRADELLLIDQSLQDRGMLREQTQATRLDVQQKEAERSPFTVPKEEITALQQRRQEIMTQLGIRHQDIAVDTNSTSWKATAEDVVGRYSLDHWNRDEVERYRQTVNDLGNELETIDYRLQEARAPLLTEDRADREWFASKSKVKSAAAERAALRKMELAKTLPATTPVPPQPSYVSPAVERRAARPSAVETVASTLEVQQMVKEVKKLQSMVEKLIKDEQAILASLSGWRSLMAKVRTPDVLKGIRLKMKLASRRVVALTSEIAKMKQEVQQPEQREAAPTVDPVTEPTLPAVSPVNVQQPSEVTADTAPAVTSAVTSEVTPPHVPKGVKGINPRASRETPERASAQVEIVPTTERPPIVEMSILNEVADDELDAAPSLPETIADLRKQRLAILSILGLDTDNDVVQADVTDRPKLREALMHAKTDEDATLKKRMRLRGTPLISVSLTEDMHEFDQWLLQQASELLDIERRLAAAKKNEQQAA